MKEKLIELMGKNAFILVHENADGSISLLSSGTSVQTYGMIKIGEELLRTNIIGGLRPPKEEKP